MYNTGVYGTKITMNILSFESRGGGGRGAGGLLELEKGLEILF